MQTVAQHGEIHKQFYNNYTLGEPISTLLYKKNTAPTLNHLSPPDPEEISVWLVYMRGK